MDCYMRLIFLLIIFNVLFCDVSYSQNNTWVPWGNVPNAYIIKFIEGTNGNIFVLLSGLGLYRGNNKEPGWIPKSDSLKDFSIASNFGVALNGDIYLGSHQGVCRSSNQGDTWNLVTDSSIYGHIAINQYTSEIYRYYFAYGAEMLTYYSTDSGVTWIKIPDRAWGVTSIDDMYFAPSGEKYIQTFNEHGLQRSGLFQFSDLGYNYTTLLYSTDSYQPILSGFGFTSQYYFVTRGGSGIYSGIYRSPRNVLTWSNINYGLTDLNITSFAINSWGYLYAGTGSQGVFCSKDTGNSWFQINNGLTDSSIESLYITKDDYIIAGTSSGNIFMTNQPTSIRPDGNNYSPVQYDLKQNYPNPFNPETNISFSIATKSFTKLIIYDIMGKEIITLISEELPAGTYSRQWLAKGIPSGVYFYQLQSGAFSQTKKLILMK